MQKTINNLGICVLFLGIAMAVFGLCMFSYSGSTLSPWLSSIGKYSFLYFPETILIGGVALIAAQFFKK